MTAHTFASQFASLFAARQGGASNHICIQSSAAVSHRVASCPGHAWSCPTSSSQQGAPRASRATEACLPGCNVSVPDHSPLWHSFEKPLCRRVGREGHRPRPNPRSGHVQPVHRRLLPARGHRRPLLALSLADREPYERASGAARFEQKCAARDALGSSWQPAWSSSSAVALQLSARVAARTKA